MASKFLLIPLLVFTSYCIGQAQRVFYPKSTTVQTELGTFLTQTETVPFWLRANQYDQVPLKGSLATWRMTVASDYGMLRPGTQLTTQKKLDWGYGLALTANTSPLEPAQLLLTEAYLKGRWGQVELYAGRRRELVGLVDTLLTTGAYAWSGNALPIPKIQVNTRGFVEVPLTKGWLAFNASFGNGWFENSGKRVQDTRLHQSALYLRLGKPAAKIRLYGGISHFVVWGGYSPTLPNSVSNNGQLPSNLKAYLYVVTALAYPTSAVDLNVSSIDELNRIGNHLGSVDLGAEVRLGNLTWFLYRQNPYDTGALFYLQTLADGLNGLSIRRHQPGTGFLTVDRVLVEWLFTNHQGGDIFIVDDPKNRGRINYFNNEQYQDGWKYYGRTIGTPFFTPREEIKPANLPYQAIANNRVSVGHVGLAGTLNGRFTYQLKLSYSRNLGTYTVALPNTPMQFSGLLQFTAPITLPVLGALKLNVRGALDLGDLLPTGSGLYLGIRKDWRTPSASYP